MTSAARRYRDRISQDPQVMVGKPVVKGTRIPVELVLSNLLPESFAGLGLFTDYPRLTLEDVKACLRTMPTRLTRWHSPPGFPLARE